MKIGSLNAPLIPHELLRPKKGFLNAWLKEISWTFLSPQHPKSRRSEWLQQARNIRKPQVTSDLRENWKSETQQKWETQIFFKSEKELVGAWLVFESHVIVGNSSASCYQSQCAVPSLWNLHAQTSFYIKRIQKTYL